MTKVKVVFDSGVSTKILDILKLCSTHERQLLDFQYSNEKKKGFKLINKYGATKLPFIVFEKQVENEDIEYSPVWIGDLGEYPTVEKINEILNEG